ncbi:alkaline phosphatase PhoX [Actinokineospora globicatena]|uniref:DUF839 domain-containing protein n=1 Tax=Actinokineospora globicatena TaxID=103729 RepID=A0A9W6QQE9_9PSEU|nr:alkaline phosphatase PhoX [Actinokineospora globicatena]GLW92724.1 hypothetical protein Aglo03_35400 [Actinokineospora globicatena]
MRYQMILQGPTALDGSSWAPAFAASAEPGPSPYGALRPADADGFQLPEGFTCRLVTMTGWGIPDSPYSWHHAPSGGACFASGARWIYVSNSAGTEWGGAGAVVLNSVSRVADGYAVLTGSTRNHAGGATPWRTWLSCEQVERGRVFETDPWGERPAVDRPALGRFRHDAVAVDPDHGCVYLTESTPDSCFYRFRPDTWPDLSSGVLEVMTGADDLVDGPVGWAPVPDPAGDPVVTRAQVAGAKRFNRGEGCHYAAGTCWFTTQDDRMWAYDAAASTITVANGAAGVVGGDLFVPVAEPVMGVDVVTPEGAVAPFLRVSGHSLSQVVGLALRPHGGKLYFSSQLGTAGTIYGGITYQVTGPFRG